MTFPKQPMALLAFCLLGLFASTGSAQGGAKSEVARWEARAKAVTITRDDWGIAHIRARTDADAVFGMMYAQAEDDFNRVETNYLNSLGRLAEAEGDAVLFQDLRQRLFIDEAELKRLYLQAPSSLRQVMNAWADGLNYYLQTHPNVKPRVLTRFEPWMPLSFSEGSIGGDIERVSVKALQKFYEDGSTGGTSQNEPEETPRDLDLEPRGSNGIAISPSHSSSGKALFLINPHTSFYFRSEAQVTSDEGLNAYGASTWGQFFIYQGFNERLGWMHTSSGVDNIDEYIETIEKRGDKHVYKHGPTWKPVTTRKVTLRYKTATGVASRDFTVYRTHHGPIVRLDGKNWISIAMMEAPLKALTQSYSRTKARNFTEFRKIMDLHTNSSNNTIYADRDGVTAYFHANFAPRRDTKFDWSKPVDGSDPTTDWKGVHSVEESPLVVSPKNGWLYNTNNWPYSAAGENSPKRDAFPSYMEEGVENPRGVHAIRVLSDKKDFTIDSLITAAYDSYLPAFADMISPLVKAWTDAPETHPMKTPLGDAIALLRSWDYRWGATSVPTSLAVFWGEEMWQRAQARAREWTDDENVTTYDAIVKKTTDDEKLEALDVAMKKLTADFGSWRTPWGDINRFQRLTADIAHPFNDAGDSTPVPFTSSRWGSLASFGARAYPQTKKWYGTSGNSFVAAVEFGDRIRAKAVMAGGQSGDTKSKHFKDQIDRYVSGNLRDLYFYPEDLKGHTERTYTPGR